MKTIFKQKYVAIAAALALGLPSAPSGAEGINGVLDGMFTNITAPSIASSQFRGAISGGSVYLRVPNSNIQLMSLDPPRLSVGCAGIDGTLGAFSFITADKLTAFMRQIAQSAGPLIFKMALKQMFPNLADELAYFEGVARAMNNFNKSSCQLAHGFLGDLKNPDPKSAEEAFENAKASTTATVKGWFDDFNAALVNNQSTPSGTSARINAAPAGDLSVGNATWNALQAKAGNSYVFSITDDPIMARQVLLSLLGTRVVGKPGPTPESPVDNKPYLPKLRLSELFTPSKSADGSVGVPIYGCSADQNQCLSPADAMFYTPGVNGYVLKMLYGTTDPAPTAQPGSIIDRLTNCSGNGCGLSSTQLKFLSLIQKVPVVALLMRSQNSSNLMNTVARELVEPLTDQISLAYGRSIIQTSRALFTGTNAPPPEGLFETLRDMQEDMKVVEERSSKNIQSILKLAEYIDAANRTNGATMRFRMQR